MLRTDHLNGKTIDWEWLLHPMHINMNAMGRTKMHVGKNKIIIDFVMLIAMALVSISGFILEIVIPSPHAVRFQSVTHGVHTCLVWEGTIWGNSFVAGVVLLALLAIHILSHINMVSAFVKKKCPNHILRVLLLYFVFDATDNNNNALALFMLLIATSQLITLLDRLD